MTRFKKPKVNRRLRLEALLRSEDGLGGRHSAWQQLGVLWAEVKALSARSGSEAGTETTAQAFQITLRAAPHGSPDRPVPGQRFRDGTRRFAIETVAQADAAGRYLRCRCREEVLR